MKKLFASSTKPLLLFIVLFQLTSCQKILDKIFPGGGPNDGNSKKCQIKKLKGWLQDTATFYYNAAGNPDRIEFPQYGMSSMFHFFKYDNKKRLTEYRVNIDTNQVAERHRYGYMDNTDRIVTDTIQLYLYGVKFVSTFEYDAKDRIVKEHQEMVESHVGELSDPETFIYEYDANDNLVVDLNPPYNSYDDKINPHRINKYWAFLARNYSKNNIMGPVAYNSKGLPTEYLDSDLTITYFLQYLDPTSYIEYECK